MESVTRDSVDPTTAVDEEAAKRNTDCVYFLASPLTCKKGNECEYRHSEGARINPRDCWFWLNGNCLNPKCSFRHPPLDGFVGSTGATSAGPSLPTSQTAGPTQMPIQHTPAVYTSNKQSTPCFYFQKGHCLKGDRCPFVHGSKPISNPVPQQTSKVAATSVNPPSQTLNKSLGALEKFTSQQTVVAQVNISTPAEVLHAEKPAVKKPENTPNNGILVRKAVLPITPLADELPISMQTNALPLDECFHNTKEADEFLGESSPGFDVLVDDEVEDSDYFLNEDEFERRLGGHRERHSHSMKEFDHNHSDYDSIAKFDREPYNDLSDHDQYGRSRDQFGWDHRRAASSERILERKGLLREENRSDQIEVSDLRHRLSKQRRHYESRSDYSPDRRRGELYRREDRPVEEQRYRGHSRRDQRHFPHENSSSNRLQGRIMLPRRSSPDITSNKSHQEMEMDRGRNWNRSSPGRSISYQGRNHDRIKRRIKEDFTTEGRNYRGHPIKRDEVDSLDFAKPKSLAELKGAKVSDNELNSVVRVTGRQEPEGSLLFQGPKPLNVILKRKREATEFGNDTVSSHREEGYAREKRAELMGSCGTSITEIQIIRSSESEREACRVTAESVRTVEEDDEEEEGQVSMESYQRERSAEVMGSYGMSNKETETTRSSELGKEANRVTTETVGIVEEEEIEDEEVRVFMEGGESVRDGHTMEDHNLDTSDQRDGEFNYDPIGDEEEYLDDEDGDDFASRLGGVMFS